MSENYFNITLFSMAKSRKLICGFFSRYVSQDQKYKQAPPQIKKVKNKQKLKISLLPIKVQVMFI